MLLTLPFVFDRAAAREAAVVWSRLSAVAHHHVYEMPPTVEELDTMLDIVDDVLDAVRIRTASNLARQNQVTQAPS